MQKLGFCGDDCNVCPRYIATQSGDVEQLKKVAVLWYKVGYRDRIVPPEELACSGCFSRTYCDRMYVRECVLKKCVENCGKCENYPCENIVKAFEQTASFAKKIKNKCSKAEYVRLRKAFFEKKKNLDKVNKEWLPQKKKT
jgi:hypothetical protein